MIFFISCQQEGSVPDIESTEYKQAVSDFYVSLAASQTDEARFAFNKMNDVALAFPQEAAAWANLAVYAMRQGNFELAEDRIGRALDLQPEHPDILFQASLIESRRGFISGAIAYLREAAAADPDNLLVQYTLARELEREDDTAHAEEIKQILEGLHQRVPDNQVVLLELIRLAVKEEQLVEARELIDRLAERSTDWEPENRDQLDLIREIVAEEDFADLTFELSFLRSGLEPQPRFQSDLLQVQLPPTEVGFLIPRFLWLPQPGVSVAEPDMGLTFTPETPELPVDIVQLVRGVTLLEDLPPFPISISNGEVVIDDEVRFSFPGDGQNGFRQMTNAFTEIDYNYNFRNDLAFAGNGGFRLYHHNEDGTFLDVSDELGLHPQTLNMSYRGVWAFDIDMDGDLDLILAPEGVSPFILRNNGDPDGGREGNRSTFLEVHPFDQPGPAYTMKWADLNGDGAPEAVFLTLEGTVTVYENLWGGEFSSGIPIARDVAAITVADIHANGQIDIVSVRTGGTFQRHFYDLSTGEWREEELIPGGEEELDPASTALFAADMDNNGALDLLLSTPGRSSVWLGGAGNSFIKLESDLPGGVTSVFDINGNERLDLMGVSPEGVPFQLMNSGTKNYFARSIRARASGTEGDQRINSFGIGGEMEVRSGLLYQKQLISSPIVHFGLGEYEEAEMLRIIWPNGSVQAEFAELGIGATIFNEQILKGSCPWLFTNDGEEIHFITDILWRSPLGLRINARETAGIIQTLDRVKIPGERLNPADGFYDLRITAELWETHFFDYVSLVAVDHPEGTEIFVDERFVFPAPDLSTRLMTIPQPVARVTDPAGNDVTGIVSELNGSYLAPFNKTAYQGWVEEHTIEIELGEEAPQDAPLWLVLSGWLRPTDSSINLAISQGFHDGPEGLTVEVADGFGGWFTLHDNYGIPAGKLKTILIDLADVFPDPADRRVRLTTTSEIYWDAIRWAEKLDDGPMIRETGLTPDTMELVYRGFSEWNRADAVSPKLPTYSGISGTAQRWRDLEGFHTRFGDVSELLAEIDDRYVIMNAGDELRLRFQALEAPVEGWTRSYVFVSDGWVKDGDYNTEASATVLPLPWHGQADYEYTRGGSLRDDPVYQQHRNDWILYHTRYITPTTFRNVLLFDDTVSSIE